jgi:hypothetical protein
LNAERFAQNDWNGERNAERFVRNDWNGERKAERFARNGLNLERNTERFAWNDSNGELFERFGLDFKICISETLAIYYFHHYHLFIYLQTLRNFIHVHYLVLK